MKTLRQTRQFKKDLKRVSNQPRKLQKLAEVLSNIANEGLLPVESRPHSLTGDYKGYMECHIEGDFLLVWIDENEDVVALMRLGSHSELFGKGVKR